MKNKIHRLKFPKNEDVVKEKKAVDYLYIEADEDHVSLQFREKKGDLTENENHCKNNCLITKLVYVLDGFHLEKYIIKLTSHMLDTKEEAKEELRRAIRKGTKEDFREVVERLKLSVESNSRLQKIEKAGEYILSNWTAAKYRLRHKEGVVGSSTEGHVSHLLSDRMSSRPMGWCQTGADKMSQLRAYDKNGGDMLELVRYQKRDLPKAAGAEYEVLSSAQIQQSEKSRHGELGKYVETIHHHMSLQNKKTVYFNRHIWGL